MKTSAFIDTRGMEEGKALVEISLSSPTDKPSLLNETAPPNRRRGAKNRFEITRELFILCPLSNMAH
jgi:hypothetical protein